MGENSKIEWTDHTFNPWIGCTKVAAGCKNCYAEQLMDSRYGKAKWGPHGTRVLTSESNWRKPLQWSKAAAAAGVRQRVFCASLADVFEDWAGQPRVANGQSVIRARHNEQYPGLMRCSLRGGSDAATLDDVRRGLFALIDATPWLDWLLLTKRPENVLRMWPTGRCNEHLYCNVARATRVTCPADSCDVDDGIRQFHRRNVWIGTSISTQSDADRNIQHLLKCRDLSPVLFLSIEPLLGPVDLVSAMPSIDWVIVGGESGPGARPMHPGWVRSLRDQCQAAGAPFFFKQWGEHSLHEAVENPPKTVSMEPPIDCSAMGKLQQWDAEAGAFVAVNGKATVREIFKGGAVFAAKVGRSQAGRELDGRTWDEFPVADVLAG